MIQMTRKPNIQERLKVNNFDGLRLLFASMVVLFHVGILTNSKSLFWMTEYISSTFAVQAFFFVSGFLVFMSCERSGSLKSYFKKRFFRIVPAYLAVVLCAAFLLVFLSNLAPKEYFSSPGWWRYVIYNITLANFTAPDLPGVFMGNHESAVNGSLWTIKIEVAFYCVVPLLVAAIRYWGYRRVLSAAFFLSIIWKCGFLIAESVTQNELFFKLSKQLPGQLAFFMGGAYAYYRTRDGESPPSIWLAIFGVAIYWLSEGLIHQALAPFCVIAVVYWLAIATPRVWSAESSGDFSYGLYLIHFPLVQVCISKGLLSSFGDYGFVFFVLFVSAIFAWFSWNFIEKPALTFSHGS